MYIITFFLLFGVGLLHVFSAAVCTTLDTIDWIASMLAIMAGMVLCAAADIQRSNAENSSTNADYWAKRYGDMRRRLVKAHRDIKSLAKNIDPDGD